MKNLMIVSLFALVATGCVVKQKVMDVSLVSMTHPYMPEGSKLKDMGPVKGQFCSDSGDKGEIGLFDEAVKSAQKKHDIEFISNASFWSEGSCVTIEGTGQKLLTGAASASTAIPTKKK